MFDFGPTLGSGNFEFKELFLLLVKILTSKNCDFGPNFNF